VLSFAIEKLSNAILDLETVFKNQGKVNAIPDQFQISFIG
jgi:hypothetical protein